MTGSAVQRWFGQEMELVAELQGAKRAAEGVAVAASAAGRQVQVCEFPAGVVRVSWVGDPVPVGVSLGGLSVGVGAVGGCGADAVRAVFVAPSGAGDALRAAVHDWNVNVAAVSSWL